MVTPSVWGCQCSCVRPHMYSRLHSGIHSHVHGHAHSHIRHIQSHSYASVKPCPPSLLSASSPTGSYFDTRSVCGCQCSCVRLSMSDGQCMFACAGLFFFRLQCCVFVAMSLASKSPEFQAWAAQANAVRGGDPLDEEWLLELWTGADGDANRALNFVLDTPEDKVRRAGKGGKKKKDKKEKEKDHGHSHKDHGHKEKDHGHKESHKDSHKEKKEHKHKHSKAGSDSGSRASSRSKKG